MLKAVKISAPTIKKPSLWDKIKMYFKWGEYASLPDLEPEFNLDEEPEILERIKSMPYIITIENTSKVEQPCVILGCHKYLTEDNYGNNKNIKLSSNVYGVSYQEILQQFTAMPQEFGLVRLTSSNSNQVLQTYKLTSKDANGSVIQKVIVPILDPYQQQSTTTKSDENFVIDGNLNIKTTILPKTTLSIHLYPISARAKISSFESLANLIGYERKKYASGNYAMVG